MNPPTITFGDGTTADTLAAVLLAFKNAGMLLRVKTDKGEGGHDGHVAWVSGNHEEVRLNQTCLGYAIIRLDTITEIVVY